MVEGLAGRESLAIVIASKNRTENIRAALVSIGLQTRPPDEVVVVDQSDAPYDLSAFAGVRHVYDPTINGASMARNRGVDLIQSAWVLFIDDDVELCSGTLAALAAAFEAHPDAVGFQCEDLQQHEYGRLTSFMSAVFEQGYFSKRHIRRGRAREATWLSGFAMALRTSVMRQERFDERLAGYSFGEDWELSKRARRFGRLMFADGAGVYHHESGVNRFDRQKMCRLRWANYSYFYRKHGLDRTLSGKLQFAWWTCGETYRWLRLGMGVPWGQRAVRSSTVVSRKGC